MSIEKKLSTNSSIRHPPKVCEDLHDCRLQDMTCPSHSCTVLLVFCNNAHGLIQCVPVKITYIHGFFIFFGQKQYHFKLAK
jgi:hypothetical protein